MFKNILVTLSLCLTAVCATAQTRVSPGRMPLKDSIRLLNALDSQFIKNDYRSLEIINYYPIGENQHWISVACYDSLGLTRIMSFIADNKKIKSPVTWLTRNWKTKQIGNITYHYADYIDEKRAAEFDKKNTRIAKKLGLTPEKLDFYLTGDFQQNLVLRGYTYDAASAGRTRDGSGDEENRIFSIMHNEDFSHDITHYYVYKIRTNTRNSAAEEGLAYYWGNAYYTDPSGNMIDYPTQLTALGDYLQTHSDSSLLSLFQHNIKPLPQLAPELSARSIIAARIAKYIEDTKGIAGIKALINCGKGDDNYFHTLDSLTSINRSNFDVRLHELLNEH